MAQSIEEVSKPKGIDQVLSQAGIKGSSGSFDFAEEERQKRLMEDTRHLTFGGVGSAPPVTPGRDAERNLRRAIEAGLAPDPMSLNNRIYAAEASPSDVRNNTMSVYFEKNSKTYNVGPGLNLDSPLVTKALEKRGLNSRDLKNTYDFQRKESVGPELVPVMREVFNDVVEGAKKDARTYVGAGIWNKLKPHEQEALTDMSYNLGLKKLGGFKNMRAAIIAMVKNGRTPETIQAVTEQMVDSNWFNQVGNRAIKVITAFANGEDSDTKRWLEFSG